jgi:hypothetical protein
MPGSRHPHTATAAVNVKVRGSLPDTSNKSYREQSLLFTTRSAAASESRQVRDDKCHLRSR